MPYDRQSRGFNPRLLIGAVIALAGVCSYMTVQTHNDVTGENQHVGGITPQQEVALGLEAAPDMEAQYGGEVADPQIHQYVESVGQRVVAKSSAQKGAYKYDFHVLADPETINAFALPGGQVFITMGLLTKLHDEAELAAVLGHEIGHVVGRHGAEHLAKQQLSGALVGAVGVATSDPDRPGRGMRNAALAAAVAQMMDLRYGRNDELEADALGVRFMHEAGYDPEGAVDLMKILAKASSGNRTPEFFSTHPNPENRLAKLEELVKENGNPGGERAPDRFQANVSVAREGKTGIGGSGW